MKKLTTALAALACMATASAQSAPDAFTMARQDLKGTARFMSMGGAFGALGGDLTTLSYNPAGIGVYRSSEIGMTMDLSLARSTMDFAGSKTTDNMTRFLFNNVGYVGTARMNSAMRNFNWGFTYNRVASFNRSYRGSARAISNSMSNYMAGVANGNQVWLSDLQATGSYDPYLGYTDYMAPWICILGYESNLISPTTENDEDPGFVGLYGDDTSGSSYVRVEERGGIDEYNISFGGNFANFLYWGMDFGIQNVDFTRRSFYGEMLDNAYVGEDGEMGTQFVRSAANWSLDNYYSVTGSGWNYKLGVILKPIQELRLGFAFHTPTWYSLTEEFGAGVDYNYPDTNIRAGSAQTNGGYSAFNDFNLRTPWRFIASAAGVIDGKMIISADVDWTSYQHMRLSDPYFSTSWISMSDPFEYTNQDIRDYYKTQVSFRAGVEYRALPDLSVRLGYAHTDTPVRPEASGNEMTIYTAGTNPSYEFDGKTDYVTGGLGYRHGHFYMDAAYVYRHRSSQWHAFTPDPENPSGSGAQATLSAGDSQVVLSLGFKF